MSLPFGFIDGIGGPELLVVMVVVLMLFGSDKLPGLAKGMGKSIREFKKAASGVEEEIRQALDETPEPKRTPPPAPPVSTVPRPPFDDPAPPAASSPEPTSPTSPSEDGTPPPAAP